MANLLRLALKAAPRFAGLFCVMRIAFGSTALRISWRPTSEASRVDRLVSPSGASPREKTFMSPIAEWRVWITGVGDPVKQIPACPALKTRASLLWAGLEGLFRIIRQLVGKQIKKPYGCSKKRVNNVHTCHISVQRVKKARQSVGFLCQKTFNLSAKHSPRQIFDSRGKTPRS
jgi:hypothetical protein